jgi:hypothetical protein
MGPKPATSGQDSRTSHSRAECNLNSSVPGLVCGAPVPSVCRCHQMVQSCIIFAFSPNSRTWKSSRKGARSRSIIAYSFKADKISRILAILCPPGKTALPAPVQTYLIDGILNLWKSDSISQFGINGLEAPVTIQQGMMLTDISNFERCALPMLSGTFRMWTITTQVSGPKWAPYRTG